MTNAPADQQLFLISQHAIDPGTCVVCVEGELDLTTAPRLKMALHEMLHAGFKQIVVDLAEVSFLDSTSLGVLIGVKRSLDPGARLAIVCKHPNVIRIFEFAGLDVTFATFSDFDEALAHVRGSADPAS
ncbi:MAG TPA: STAS domain-containing protein [Solirubrobacteraceae bacterium]|nr:STAS domain-containing protein [Solirubrobacteraceae bacterium]